MHGRAPTDEAAPQIISASLLSAGYCSRGTARTWKSKTAAAAMPMGKTAPCSKLMEGGSLLLPSSGRIVYVCHAPPEQPVTRSPGTKCITPGPTLTTSPATSLASTDRYLFTNSDHS